MKQTWLLAMVISSIASASVLSQGIFVQNVRVQQESRLDWKYAAYGKSRKHALNPRMAEYSSRDRRYDLFGPPVPPETDLPLILFISPGEEPLEWKHFSRACRKHGVLFAGVRDAGNTHSIDIRIRAALDVLSDVRRLYRVDPDRTYVAGFSGGANVPTRLAYALPECFGGLFCIGQRVSKPRTDALIARATERISVAALCGAKEPVGPEVEHVDSLVCTAMVFRNRCFVSRGGRHRMPKAGVIESAFNWLEEGREQRMQLAKRYKSTRVAMDQKYDVNSWRYSLLRESEKRWRAAEYATAVTLLGWIEDRWPNSKEAVAATEKLERLAQESVYLENKKLIARERDSKVQIAILTGYETLANDDRNSTSAAVRARYATYAIRQMELSDIELAQREERMERLRRIASGEQ